MVQRKSHTDNKEHFTKKKDTIMLKAVRHWGMLTIPLHTALVPKFRRTQRPGNRILSVSILGRIILVIQKALISGGSLFLKDLHIKYFNLSLYRILYEVLPNMISNVLYLCQIVCRN